MLVDAFIFFNEYDMLEGRLEYLNDTVDHFVIVESDLTFSGNKKPFNYEQNKARFSKYSDKITYHHISPDFSGYDFSKKPDVMDYNAPHWQVERYQRNAIADAVKHLPDDTYILVSDVDEIPNKRAVTYAMTQITDDQPILLFRQQTFFYNLSTRMTDIGGTCLLRNKKLQEVKPQWLRENRRNLPYVNNAGWHLSYWNTPELISKKIQNFAHQEYNNDRYTNIGYIKDRIKEGSDPFMRPENPSTKFDKNTLPKDFLSVFEKYETR